MRRPHLGASAFALAIALVMACGKDDAPGNPAPDGGGGSSTGAGGSSTGGSGGTGGSIVGDGGLVPCLERPTELERPPAGELPCDLLPPDFGR